MALIEKGMKRPPIDDDFFSDLNFAKTSKVSSAKDLIKNLNIKSYPVDLHKILKELNITYKESALPNDTSGILERINSEKDEYIIIVNKNHPPARKNFTIAHELGHYCLHRNQKNKFEDHTFFRNKNSSTEESQANIFAAELLMPEEEFLNVINRGVDTITELSEEFSVSTLAVRVRAQQLGLIGHGL